MQCFSDVVIWDIAAGSHYSLFIGDMSISKRDVYLCGRQPRYAYSSLVNIFLNQLLTNLKKYRIKTNETTNVSTAL